jgi:TonB family protein
MKTIISIICMIMLAACSSTPAIKQVQVKNTVTFTGEYSKVCDAFPRVIYQPKPEYPAECRGIGITGETTISFMIELDGSTSQVQVAYATNTAFGEAARSCVMKYKFQPVLKDGKPIRFATNVPIFFSE